MKKIIWVFGILLLLAIIIPIILLFNLSKIVTTDFLVKQIESNINVKAEISSVKIDLMSILSSIEIKGLKLTSRDSDADSGVSIEKRKKIISSIISADTISCKVALLPLLSGKLQWNEFILREPSIALTIFESGGNNLKPLFRKPLLIESKPNPALMPEEIEKRKKEEKEKASEIKEPFSAKDLPIAIYINKIALENAHISVLLEKTSQKLVLNPANVAFTSIKINPENLTKENSLNVNVNFVMSILNLANTESSKLIFNSNGTLVPFDSKSGLVNPSVIYDLYLKKGSYVSGFALFDSLSGKMPALEKIGIKLNALTEKAELENDMNLKIEYANGNIIFLKSVNFKTKNFSLSLEQGNFLNPSKDTHSFSGTILASKEDSDKALEGLNKSIATASKSIPVDELKNKLLGSILKEGRISLPFKSSGSLKNPSVVLLIELPSLSDILKGTVLETAKSKALEEMNKKLPPGVTDEINKGLKGLGF